VSVELKLSVQANNAALIQPFLAEFEARYGIHVRLHVSDWMAAWSEVTRTALYHSGPDVSEVGSTWLGDLNAANTLRPFAPHEISQIRKQDDFLPVALAAARLPRGSSVCAIPWMVNARLIFYRRRWLEQCGLDPTTAFSTPAQLEHTLARLQAAGAGAPWLTSTQPTRSMLQNTCMWVWANDGELLVADGQRVLFDQPPALAGYSQYFALGRYLAPPLQKSSTAQLGRYFITRPDAAVMLNGPWFFEDFSVEQRDEFGLALPLGRPFLGASYLVVWQHSRQVDAALKLIRFLTETPTLMAYSQRLSLLPAQLHALNTPPYSDDPWWQMAGQAVKVGHAATTTVSWGIMEEQLRFELAEIWQEVLNDPCAEPYPIVARRLSRLAQQINARLTPPARQRSVPSASTGYWTDHEG
jgi:multiple sugar transport system substrate-binding protein